MGLKPRETPTRSQMSDPWKDDKTQAGEGASWGPRPSGSLLSLAMTSEYHPDGFLKAPLQADVRSQIFVMDK